MFFAKHLFFLSFLFSILEETLVCASETEIQSNFESLIETKHDLNAFKKNYLEIVYGKNFPMSYGQTFFKPALPHFSLGFQYVLDSKWILGIGAEFKRFELTEDYQKSTNETALLTLSLETLRMIRIHHPLYLVLGYKLLTLNPSKKATLPIQKEDQFEVEVGISLGGGIAVLLKDQSYIMFKIDRWRGTKTQRLQGLDVNLSYSYPL